MDKPVTTSGQEIFIVDDDPNIRDALSLVFSHAGYRTTTFEDGRSLLRAARAARPACILLDMYMPGPSGLDILKELDASTYPVPIVMLSGQGDIPSVVEAIRSGAHDFIEKRVDAKVIVGRVRETIDASEHRRQNGASAKGLLPTFRGYELLTPREREVLSQITASASNKEIARNLAISSRTVEVHRGHIMQKLNAKNSIDLACIVFNQKRAV